MNTLGYYVSGDPLLDAVTAAQAAYDQSRMVGSGKDAQDQYELQVKLKNAQKAYENSLINNPKVDMKKVYIYGGVAAFSFLLIFLLARKK